MCAPPKYARALLFGGLAACAAPGAGPEPGPDGVEPERVELAPVWAPAFAVVERPTARCAAPGAASVVRAPDDWSGLAIGEAHVRGIATEQAGLLSADGRPAVFDLLREHPDRVGCATEALGSAVEAALASPTPVAALVRLGATALGSPVADDVRVAGASFAQARAALCEAAGGCGAEVGAPSEAMQASLAPVLIALADAVAAQAALFEGDARGEAWWREHGGHLTLLGQQRPNPGFGPDRALLLDDREQLYAAAERLAVALERARWPETDELYALPTGRGLVEVAGRGADTHVAPALFRLDLGGDDVYLAVDLPVAVSVDLGGADVYAYPGAEGVESAAELPADEAGRGDVVGLATQATLSEVPRQGAARGGVSLLFDLGASPDRYVTLRGGQGYAQLGVGVLFDDGGDDLYVAEAGAQGSAQFGIGLLVDLGAGADRYSALHASQGFAGPAGFGALVDDGGADAYGCASAPARHPAPQRPEVNASFCQGASLGFHAEVGAQSLSGGLGLLWDRAGDDTYDAAVFAQGAGYWMGSGLLIDEAGADAYRHVWYAAGAAAHFGVGVLADQGGHDVYGGDAAANMTLGAAHHFGLGALLDADGDDRYLAPSLSAGASSCGSLGLFVDAAGDDVYEAPSGLALGVAALGECEERAQRVTRGLFVDASGLDVYPETVDAAGDGATWGRALDGHATEQARGMDTSGPAP